MESCTPGRDHESSPEVGRGCMPPHAHPWRGGRLRGEGLHHPLDLEQSSSRNGWGGRAPSTGWGHSQTSWPLGPPAHASPGRSNDREPGLSASKG